MEFRERTVPETERLAIGKFLLDELRFSHSHVVDLGAGHCKFSMAAAEAGMKVTAMDARIVRVPDNLHPAITFVHGDFLTMPPPFGIDLVLMLGIFYHLDVHQQKLLLEMYGGHVTVIDTHYVLESDATEKMEEGYCGKLYHEGSDVETMMANPKASASTLSSFWHTEESLLKMLELYFYRVTKILPEHYPCRTYFICEPSTTHG